MRYQAALQPARGLHPGLSPYTVSGLAPASAPGLGPSAPYSGRVLAPTPVLKPSPLDLGDVFAGTFEILKRRFGTFISLSALSMALPITLLVGAGLFVLLSVGVTAWLRTLTPAAIAGAVVVFIAALIMIGLAQLKVQGMLSLGAYEVAQGGRPDIAGLWTRSRGFLRRIIPAILLIGLIVVGVNAVLGVAFFGAFGAATTSGSRNSSGAAVGFILVGIVAVLALAVFGFVASIKLLYLVYTAAIEETPGLAALKRSWNLTKGSFWRTFGYYFLGSLVASFAAMPVSFVSQAMVGPLSTTSRTPSQTELLAIIPMMLFIYALQFAIQILVLPFITAYVTVMFIDQVRRREQPVERAWVPGQPQGFYAQGWTSQPPQPQGWTSQPPPAQGWTPQPPYGQQPPAQWPPQNNWPGQGGYPPQQP